MKVIDLPNVNSALAGEQSFSTARRVKYWLRLLNGDPIVRQI